MKNSPFEDLRRRLGMPESADAPPAEITPPVAPEVSGVRGRGPARAVVRMERAGRSGKEATVVEQLGLSTDELHVWLKALKNALGCGGTVEGANVMLQGDHRTRVAALLSERGVRKVIVG